MITKPKFKFYHKLAQRKHREYEKMFLVEGVRSVQEALTAKAKVEAVFTLDQTVASAEVARLAKEAENSGAETFRLTNSEFSLLSDTVTSQGIIAAVREAELPAIETVLAGIMVLPAIIVALDAVSEPGNLGAIIRTCDWFGVSAVLLGKECVELHNPKVVRATMGSLFHLPILEGVDLAAVLPQLRQKEWEVFTAELTANEDIRSVQWPSRIILVIGNEARGISSEVSAASGRHVSIPSFGKAESLNAGIAASVFLSHLMLRVHDH